MSNLDGLKTLLQEQETISSEILGIVTNAAKIVPGLSLQEKVGVVIAIRQIEEALTATRKKVNSALAKIEPHLCQALVDKDLLQFDCDGYRAYPSAEGFFNSPAVTSPGFEAFYEWVKSNQDFIERAQAKGEKRALRAVCEALLEAGRSLPPNVSSFIRARIKLRRL